MAANDDTREPVSRGDAYLPAEPMLVLHAASDGVTALVTDVRDTWRVDWSPDLGWSCTCPARTTGCGHIAACRAVVVLDRRPTAPAISNGCARPDDQLVDELVVEGQGA